MAEVPGGGQTPMRNQDLSYLTLSAGELLAQYGWYLLAATITAYLLIPHLRRVMSALRSKITPPSQHDDPSVEGRRESMEAARRRMQEELDAKAAVFENKRKQQEETKRRQKIEAWACTQQGKSCKRSQSAEEAGSPSSGQKPKADRKSLRSNDYSPLMGQGGGSCSWRPGRRGPSSGG